jgi:hypothetical protein
MKKLLAFFLSVLISIGIFAQSPEKISYQAIIRDVSDVLVSNTLIGIRISILQESTSGNAVYVETHSITTNDNGLISLEIGSGNSTDDFSQINWSDGLFFIKTEVDIDDADNYSITGISQLTSVPYAFHSNTTDTIIGDYLETDSNFISAVASAITEIDTATWNDKQNQITAGSGIFINENIVNTGSFYLGQDTLGGIVYYVYTGGDGLQHGLIVSKTEAYKMYGTCSSSTNSTSNGAYNTSLMLNNHSFYARNWAESLGPGWYVPSVDEFNILWLNRSFVNNSNATGLTIIKENIYLTSTILHSTRFLTFNSLHGGIFQEQTDEFLLMRAVKSF